MHLQLYFTAGEKYLASNDIMEILLTDCLVELDLGPDRTSSGPGLPNSARCRLTSLGNRSVTCL